VAGCLRLLTESMATRSPGRNADGRLSEVGGAMTSSL
jgi:hypothetical protein